MDLFLGKCAFKRLQKHDTQLVLTPLRKQHCAAGWNETIYLSHEDGENGMSITGSCPRNGIPHVSHMLLTRRAGKEIRLQLGTNITFHVPLIGRIKAGLVLNSGFELNGEGKDIESPFPLPDGAIAFEIADEKMQPRYDAGDAIICCKFIQLSSSAKDAIFDKAIQEIHGWEAVVQLSDGRCYLKILHHISEDRFNLIDYHGNTIENVRIEWAGKVFGVIRAREWIFTDRKLRKSHDD